MATTYDWSPLLNAINGQASNWSQRNQVGSMIDGLSGKQPAPNTGFPAQDQRMSAGQTTQGPNALAGINPQMLQMLRNAPPQVSMPLLLQLGTQQHKFSQTPQYDQNGKAFVMDDQGNPKYLDGISARPDMRVANNTAYDIHGVKPGDHIGGPEAPKMRTIQRGTTSVEQQFNPTSGVFEDIPGASGPKFKPDAPAEPVDPQTIHYWAQSVAAGQPLPALGMGKEAAMYRQAILKEAAQINSGQGLTGVDQNVNIATTKANSGALTKQTALRSATEGFENTMLQNMDVVRETLKKGAGTTGIPILNRYQQYIKGQYAGDPDVIALSNAIDTVADENAKIRSGTLGNTPATDAMRANIKSGLNSSMTPDQIEHAFQVMQKDAGNRSRALRAQEAALKSGLKGGNDMPNIPGISEPQASPAASHPATIPPGSMWSPSRQQYKTPDGKLLDKNGKPI